MYSTEEIKKWIDEARKKSKQEERKILKEIMSLSISKVNLELYGDPFGSYKWDVIFNNFFDLLLDKSDNGDFAFIEELKKLNSKNEGPLEKALKIMKKEFDLKKLKGDEK